MKRFDIEYLRGLSDKNLKVEQDFVSFCTEPVMMKLRKRLRSPQAVEDGFQETLLRVFTYFRKGHTLRIPSSLPAFVSSICGDVMYEMVRERARQLQILPDAPEAIDTKPSAETDVFTEERRVAIRRVLSRIGEKDRTLLEKLFLEEEDRDKVCREFRVSRGHLRLLLFRARSRVRALLEAKPGAGMIVAGRRRRALAS